MKAGYVLTQDDASAYDEEIIGGKARNLAWLTRNGFRVPPWIVITTRAFEEQVMVGEHDWIMDALSHLPDDNSAGTVSQEIRNRIAGKGLLPCIAEALNEKLGEFDC